MRKSLVFVLLIPVLFILRSVSADDAGTLKIELPPDTKIASAVAIASGIKVETLGTVQGSAISFKKLLPDTPYDIRLTLGDGTTLQGVNLDWYNEEEAKSDAGEIRDEDRDEITKIVTIDPFYNKYNLVLMKGDHDRVVALFQMIRDKDFYAGNGQVIWRNELCYFKNQHGGWERIAQVNKIVRRERFKTHEEFKNTTAKIKFLATLGGLKVGNTKSGTTVKIESLLPAK